MSYTVHSETFEFADDLRALAAAIENGELDGEKQALDELEESCERLLLIIKFLMSGKRGARYGITEDEYWEHVRSQGFRCAICRAPFGPGGSRMHTDHNHATGEVRGVLCNSCNMAIGMLGDSPARLRNALAYLVDRGSYGSDTLEDE